MVNTRYILATLILLALVLPASPLDTSPGRPVLLSSPLLPAEGVELALDDQANILDQSQMIQDEGNTEF